MQLVEAKLKNGEAVFLYQLDPSDSMYILGGGGGGDSHMEGTGMPFGTLEFNP